MEPEGRFVLAEGAARLVGTRERLREAAQRIDRARGRLRPRNPVEAVAHRRVLVAASWSIVDRFDSEGRRFVVAKSNGPKAERPGLTLRERQVASLLARGYPNKLIAYALGLSESTVETHIRCARTRLGVGSRVALIDLLSALAAAQAGPGSGMSGRDADRGVEDQAPPDLRASVLALDDGEYLVVSYPEPAHPGLATLTPTERGIAELVRRGLSNADIARHLGTSPRTVANQVAAVLHKLGFGSRYELAARLDRHGGNGNLG